MMIVAMSPQKKQTVIANSKRFSWLPRKDITTTYHCSVPRCTSSSRFNSYLSFHRFPRDLGLQKKWIANIKPDGDFTPVDRSRVCSQHFRKADLIECAFTAYRSTRRLQCGAVPVLFQWNNFSVPVPWDVIDYQDHDYCRPEPAALDLALQRIDALEKQLRAETIRNAFGLERFALSDEDVQFYTR